MVFLESLVSGLLGLSIGAWLMKLLLKKTQIGSYIYRAERRKRKVLNNPSLLKERLEALGTPIVEGNRLSFEVGIDESTGKETLLLNKSPVLKGSV